MLENGNARSPRAIILEEGRTPRLRGEWQIGEMLEAARVLERWVMSLGFETGAPPPMPTVANDPKEQAPAKESG